MWKLDANNVLKSKDIGWKPTYLKLSGDTEITTIKSGKLNLGVVYTEGALLEVKEIPVAQNLDSDNSQMWKKSNYQQFFTLINKMTGKVLTAVGPNGLDIIGMHLKIFRI